MSFALWAVSAPTARIITKHNDGCAGDERRDEQCIEHVRCADSPPLVIELARYFADGLGE